jgi:hypothetical protein
LTKSPSPLPSHYFEQSVRDIVDHLWIWVSV